MAEIQRYRVHVDAAVLALMAQDDDETWSSVAPLFIYRFGSGLNTHVHFHVCVVDGVFEEMPSATQAELTVPPSVVFHPASGLDEDSWAFFVWWTRDDLDTCLQAIQVSCNRPVIVLDIVDATDCTGHDAEHHERLLTGVELGNRKAACRERLNPPC